MGELRFTIISTLLVTWEPLRGVKRNLLTEEKETFYHDIIEKSMEEDTMFWGRFAKLITPVKEEKKFWDRELRKSRKLAPKVTVSSPEEKEKKFWDRELRKSRKLVPKATVSSLEENEEKFWERELRKSRKLAPKVTVSSLEEKEEKFWERELHSSHSHSRKLAPKEKEATFWDRELETSHSHSRKLESKVQKLNNERKLKRKISFWEQISA